MYAPSLYAFRKLSEIVMISADKKQWQKHGFGLIDVIAERGFVFANRIIQYPHPLHRIQAYSSPT